MSGVKPLEPLPSTYGADRVTLQRVAVHVLTRARSQAVGRIGLVPSPGGIATPAFGDDATVVRLAAASLVVDRGGDSSSTPLVGATLRSLAEAAGADLDVDLDAGHDTPPIGDVDAALRVDPVSLDVLGAWLAVGWQVIDAVLATDATLAPARTQLWPEHFDVGTTVSFGPGDEDRANLGASPGDASHPDPYLYVGPWGPRRPGDPAYWNVPFGAVLGYAELTGTDDPIATGEAFLRTGLDQLRGNRPRS